MHHTARIVLATSVAALSAYGHPGGLDSRGGHTNRQTGEYHYHRKTPNTDSAEPEAARKANRRAPKPWPAHMKTEAMRKQRLNTYFHYGNQGAMTWSGEPRPRNVPLETKERIHNRDWNQCVICGGAEQIQIDHRRALANGGGNEDKNLFTLCGRCHGEKTAMDELLRNKRAQGGGNP